MTRTITVTGTGTALAPPDLLTLQLGVETRRDDAGTAYSAAGSAADAVAAALRGHGTADTDIRTSGLNLRADVAWQEGHGQRVTGYVASAQLTVGLRSLDSASGAIAAAVAAGGNDIRVNGLELGFSDPAAVMSRARKSAWADALAKAAHFAALAEAALGAVLSVEERPAAPGPVPVARMARAAAVESVNIEAGESSVDTSITVCWELRDKA